MLARPYNKNKAISNLFSSKYGKFLGLFPKKCFAEVMNTFFFLDLQVAKFHHKKSSTPNT